MSNFQPTHLQRLLDETDIVAGGEPDRAAPVPDPGTVAEYDTTHGIATEAWSPLARGGELLRDRVITSLAEKYGKTPAQVVLRWHLQNWAMW